jgi:hypothetical protein
MTDTTDTDCCAAPQYLTRAETKRLIEQIVTHAGPGGISKANLHAAHDDFIDLVISAGLVDAWRANTIAVGYDPAARNLTFTATQRRDA